MSACLLDRKEFVDCLLCHSMPYLSLVDVQEGLL